jgi:hypothetical protein
MDILTRENPSSFMDISEIQFDQDIFLVTDPHYLQNIKTMTPEQAMSELTDMYSQDLERGGHRLHR